MNERMDASFGVHMDEFVLVWASATSMLMRDLTLGGAKSFGSAHVLHMMLNEYLLLVLETQKLHVFEEELTNDMWKCYKYRNLGTQKVFSIYVFPRSAKLICYSYEHRLCSGRDT